MELILIEMIIALGIGAGFGSFANMASHRLSIGENIIWKRSYCPGCKRKLSLYELIPILSYLLCKGRCSYCQFNIPYYYLLNELLLGSLAIYLYFLMHFTFQFWLLLIVATILLIISVIDLKDYFIPDSLQISLLIMAIIYNKISYHQLYWTRILINIAFYSLIGMVSAYLVKLWKKREALGEGDIKFLAITGIFLDYQQSPLFFAIAGGSGTILGLIWRQYKKQEIFPFAPCLALALYFNII